MREEGWRESSDWERMKEVEEGWRKEEKEAMTVSLLLSGWFAICFSRANLIQFMRVLEKFNSASFLIVAEFCKLSNGNHDRCYLHFIVSYF